ncbi:MAG: RNA polymerase sigma factor [Flavisolibacter sp.]|nr:RNA polymerase sigma factor [Flavisolibacter sp.]
MKLYSIKKIMAKFNYPQKSNASGISDKEIIVRVLNGEKDLYAMIVRRYNERLYRVGASMIHDDAEIEDAMQTAYINAYENLGKFAFKAAFSTWLTKILINECILRLKKRRSYVFLNKEVAVNRDYREQTMDVQTPAVKMLNSELKIKLEEAIRQLPEKYRVVFVMREIENMTVAETQSCLNLTEVNVKVRLNRAKALLRNALSTYYNKEEIFHFHLSRCDRMVERVMNQIKKM